MLTCVQFLWSRRMILQADEKSRTPRTKDAKLWKITRPLTSANWMETLSRSGRMCTSRTNQEPECNNARFQRVCWNNTQPLAWRGQDGIAPLHRIGGRTGGVSLPCSGETVEWKTRHLSQRSRQHGKVEGSQTCTSTLTCAG